MGSREARVGGDTGGGPRGARVKVWVGGQSISGHGQQTAREEAKVGGSGSGPGELMRVNGSSEFGGPGLVSAGKVMRVGEAVDVCASQCGLIVDFRKVKPRVHELVFIMGYGEKSKLLQIPGHAHIWKWLPGVT